LLFARGALAVGPEVARGAARELPQVVEQAAVVVAVAAVAVVVAAVAVVRALPWTRGC
jgi:hypothetical protein